MAQYRKKPVVIQAIQFNGKNAEEIEQWSNNTVKAGPVSEDTLTRAYLEIETHYTPNATTYSHSISAPH